MSEATRAALEHVLADLPDVAAELDRTHTLAWSVTDPELLDLCRIRMAMLLGDDAEVAEHRLDPAVVADLPRWPTSPRFDETQRACLAFTEQFVIDVASMDDATAMAVADRLGGDGCANFVNALLVVEQRMRLHLVWRRLFPTEVTR